MALKKKRLVPTTVLTRAAEASKKTLSTLSTVASKPLAPALPQRAKLLPREKVVAALKKLHPMD